MSYTIYLTTDCNFKCSYCYENYKQQLQLSKDRLINTINFIFHYDNSKKILLDFLGGEPLLKKNLIYQAVNYIEEQYPDRIVKYYITTNCSLMDDDFIKFMKKNNFDIRLSFDGTEKAHNLNRIPRNNEFCYEKIFQNIKKVRDSGMQYSVRMTITNETIPHMFQNIKFLHENGLNNICMIPDVYLKFSKNSLAEFKNQVEKITDYYIQEYSQERKFSIDQYDGKFLNILCDFGNHFSMCDAGISNFKIMPDGKIYPCGFLTDNEKYVIGDIHEESIDIRRGKMVALSHYDKSDNKCKDCKIRDFCHGMKCGYMNLIRTGSINIPDDSVCQYEHVFYPEVLKVLMYLSDNPDAEIKQRLNGFMQYIEQDSLRLSEMGIQIQKKMRICR
ncbi:radical SAM/SPASM domain-containing protein [Anaerocolumna xylanovorans]|uniref:Radical SAM core domain-containing protein n=1 Tax=Anaerocolumna xylanovorans DSM 12503 TaxID=1121345 RepID=A0A1M7Y991_9FIRM|nr:radical SAM protein [Anaerocolumna xylanovorans]SHO49098.1 uncharacterized protein SAMN02745217_02125 [Anaerocolumna xylanovorans DSM 12503]